MKSKRIENAIEIIDYAIKHQMSVKEASVKAGFSDTYVKNVKAMAYESHYNGTLDSEQFNQFNAAYSRYVSNSTISLYNKPEVQTTNLNSNENVSGNVPPSTNGEQITFNVNDNSAEINWNSGKNYPADHIKTLDQLLSVCEVDTKTWKVKDYTVNKWDVTAIINEEARTYQNFQVKARLEKSVMDVRERKVGEIFLDMIKNYKPPLPVLEYIPSKLSDDVENNLLEISIFDLHIGKLAWGGETFENYDTKIARERFLTSITKLLYRAGGFQYSRILFPIGNDFFNSDNLLNTTTKGTQQDEDLRWQKTFNIGVRLLVDAINLLKQMGVPVDVVVIPGNHDFERSYYMGKYLEAWFNNDPQIYINNGASPRKYYRFGNVLLGLTHGSEEKESSLPMLMATDIESKPMWSETKFHEWHLGHIHRKRNIKYELNKTRELNEDLGVTIRYLSSLTGTEEWHHKKGFVGSTKAADAFVWNHEFGLVAHLNTNIIID